MLYKGDRSKEPARIEGSDRKVPETHKSQSDREPKMAGGENVNPW